MSVLCRSERSAAAVEQSGCTPLRGDIARPTAWVPALARVDAVVHAAGAFGEDMARTDTRVTDALLEGLAADGRTRRLLYTGGIWLYGPTAAPVGDDDPLRPPPWWSWMARHADRVRQNPYVEGLVVHPANVVDGESDVPPILLREARTSPQVRLPLPSSGTWPLVREEEIAQLYALVLEHGTPGRQYIGASEPGRTVLDLARKAVRHVGREGGPVQVPLSEWTNDYGAWACGYGLSQHLVSIRAYDELGWLQGTDV